VQEIAERTRIPLLSYIANAIASGDREVPYSIVTALVPAQRIDPINELGGEGPRRQKPGLGTRRLLLGTTGSLITRRPIFSLPPCCP